MKKVFLFICIKILSSFNFEIINFLIRFIYFNFYQKIDKYKQPHSDWIVRQKQKKIVLLIGNTYVL
jgi:hypothetical protein